MTSKERVLMTIHHEEPDRVPVCATYVPEVAEKLAAKYHPDGDLGVALGNDMVKIASGLENFPLTRNSSLIMVRMLFFFSNSPHFPRAPLAFSPDLD